MPLRQPERHARRLRPQREQAELGAEPAVVAGPRLLEPLQVLLEVRLAEERGPVDAGEHLRSSRRRASRRPATELSLNALIRPVEGPCGPRQRSTKGPFR